MIELLRTTSRLWLFTLLRVLACFGLVLAFAWNVRPPVVTLPGALSVATLLSLVVAYELSIRNVRIEWLAAIVCAILCCAGLVYVLDRPVAFSGPLLAGTGSSVPASCKVSIGSAKIQLALEIPRSRHSSAFKLSRTHGCPLLSLQRSGDGVMLNAAFYGPDDDLAFRLVDNRYEPLTDLELREYRPDQSTIEIFDHLGREVFFFRWLNADEFAIRATYQTNG